MLITNLVFEHRACMSRPLPGQLRWMNSSPTTAGSLFVDCFDLLLHNALVRRAGWGAGCRRVPFATQVLFEDAPSSVDMIAALALALGVYESSGAPASRPSLLRLSTNQPRAGSTKITELTLIDNLRKKHPQLT
jgi:hypothetical protein